MKPFPAGFVWHNRACHTTIDKAIDAVAALGGIMSNSITSDPITDPVSDLAPETSSDVNAPQPASGANAAAPAPSLTLQEQLLLLCVRPRTGDIAQPHFRYMLAGAALADLLNGKRLNLELGRVQVRQTTALGDCAVDNAFVRFGTTSRPRTLAWWVRHLYSSDTEPVRILGERLTERGILTASEHRALWVIKWTTYPVLEPAYVQKLHRQIRAAIMDEGPVAPALAVLIAILHHARALDTVLGAAERMEREHRIATIAAGDPVGYMVGKALADVLIEEEIEREQARRHGHRPIVIVRPPRSRRPSHPRRPWKNAFPGARPDENGVWSVDADAEQADESTPV